MAEAIETLEAVDIRPIISAGIKEIFQEIAKSEVG